MSEPDDSDRGSEQAPPKAYETPRLITYGSIREITASLLPAGGAADGGGPINTKTNPAG